MHSVKRASLFILLGFFGDSINRKSRSYVGIHGINETVMTLKRKCLKFIIVSRNNVN